MRSEAFWAFYESIRPKLGHRANSFARMFTHLDGFDRPVGIIETGCTRQPGNWTGDGNSTVLFDKYAEAHPGSAVLSVDLDAAATAVCRTLVSERVIVHTGDSVKFLQALADKPLAALPFVDLLYLDSYDLDVNDTLPSAMHHMKELVAAAPLIRPETLVAVDDCFMAMIGVPSANGGVTLLRPSRIDGKGRFVADYAHHVGAEMIFQGYQCGWLKMRTAAPAK